MILLILLILVNVRGRGGEGPRIKASRRSALGVSPAKAAGLLQWPRARFSSFATVGRRRTPYEGEGAPADAVGRASRLQDSCSSEPIDPSDASDPTEHSDSIDRH